MLLQYYGGEFVPAQDILDSNGMIAVQKKHSTLDELIQYGVLAAEEAKSVFKIATVRNPFDSLVSLYFKQRFKYQSLVEDPASWVHRSQRYVPRMKYAQKHSFSRWFFRVSYRKLIKKLLLGRCSMYDDYTEGIDVVLRYESLETDLKHAFGQAGILWKWNLAMVNRTDERPTRDYRSFYSRSAALAARFIYSDDLKRYGYKF